jgi:DMSO reductase family type II enzyme heme b subunit
MIEANRVASVENYYHPTSPLWDECSQYTIPLQPVPTKAVTTSKYVRETIPETRIGKVREIRVNVITDGEMVAIRLEWEDAIRNDKIENYRDFVDACGVMFPIKPEASVMTMGSQDSPINVWYWRADGRFYDVISKGLGTTQRRRPEISGLRCLWDYVGTTWIVVFARPATADGVEFADLTPPKDTGIAFAVWEGSNRERGPLKAYSGDFMSFILR